MQVARVRPVAVPRRWAIALSLFAFLVTLAIMNLAYQGRPWGALAYIGVGAASVAAWRRPMVAAGFVIATSLFLQLAHAGIGYSDQTDISRMALERTLTGESPYGYVYTNRVGGLNPFPYGPLAMLTAQLAPAIEVVALAGTLALVAWRQAWITLAVVAGFPWMIYIATMGGNDGLPAFGVTLGMLLLQSHPRLGMATLAVAGAVKPHVATFFLPAIGYAGWTAGAWLVGMSAILWSPVLSWGVGNYLESLRYAAEAKTPLGWQRNTIPLPWVRVLAIPLTFAGLFVRRWEHAVWLGSAAFVAVMFFGEWGSLGYAIVFLPIAGIALETGGRCSRGRG